MTQDNTKAYLILGIVTVTTVVASGLTVGLITNKNRRQKEFAELLDLINSGNALEEGGKGSAWDASLYEKNANKIKTPLSKLSEYAKDIKEAKGSTSFTDNENKVVSIFKSLQSPYDVSALSFSFYKKYQLNLYDYLKSFMDNSERYIGDKKNYMDELNSIIKTL